MNVSILLNSEFDLVNSSVIHKQLLLDSYTTAGSTGPALSDDQHEFFIKESYHITVEGVTGRS